MILVYKKCIKKFYNPINYKKVNKLKKLSTIRTRNNFSAIENNYIKKSKTFGHNQC